MNNHLNKIYIVAAVVFVSLAGSPCTVLAGDQAKPITPEARIAQIEATLADLEKINPKDPEIIRKIELLKGVIVKIREVKDSTAPVKNPL